MRLVCAPEGHDFPDTGALPVVLYGQPRRAGQGSAGAAAKDEILRQGLIAPSRAWDLLSLSLSVVTADFAAPRELSPDGWTREIELDVAVAEPAFWSARVKDLEAALSFLTTDRWRIRFVDGGFVPPAPRTPAHPQEDSIILLSGGLDSLVGAIDLAAMGRKLFAVSQTVRGDAEKQIRFARKIGNGLSHLQVNHNANVLGEEETSQRARSLVFLAFGALVASSLGRYQDGDIVTLYVCENGFIAANPPLTGARVGSLSTRTAHPIFLGGVQRILDAADLRIRIENPYTKMTKGEMLTNCVDQNLLKTEAAVSTSCGRFQRFNYTHCGRCVPCQIRRAAFLRWGHVDTTEYVYSDLGKDDADHAAFDDVRSAAMAIAEVKERGLDQWLGMTLSSTTLGDTSPLKQMIKRGLDELEALHVHMGVK